MSKCQPDELGYYSQFEVEGGKKGIISCDKVQPVRMLGLSPEIPVVKKYGAPCKNNGMLQLKMLYVLLREGQGINVNKETFNHKNPVTILPKS